MYELYITEEAKTELARELRYSRHTWGDHHAKEYAKAFRLKIRELRHRAKEYQTRDDLLAGIRIMPYRGNQVVYTILEEQHKVVVLGIMGSGMEVNPTGMARRTEQRGE